MKKFFVILFVVCCFGGEAFAANSTYSTIGSGVSAQAGTRIGGYNNKSDASIIEYDTYGQESAYYVEDGFGMTKKYDMKGNLLSKYKTNATGKNYVYDKYDREVGYFLPVSKVKTVFYDKLDNPIGYFAVEPTGLIKKYDMSNNHLSTYKRR